MILTSLHGVNILEGHFAPHFYYLLTTQLLTMTKLNPRPVRYTQEANPNATNSELDAKVVVSDGRGFNRLTNNEWDVIFDALYYYMGTQSQQSETSKRVIREKLLSYKKEDEVVNRLCDTDLSAYKSIPSRF